MKFLGWMHRKFQNSDDFFIDFTSGHPCSCLGPRPSLEEQQHCRRRHPMDTQEILSDAVEEETMLLDGSFLSIGTLGSGAVELINDVETEETCASQNEIESIMIAEKLDAIAEKQAEAAATEAELIAVGTELEKVLAEEAEKGGDGLSSTRSSSAAAYPLQGYLFGSSVAVVDKQKKTAVDIVPRLKNRRVSLRELFLKEEAEDEGEARSTGGMQAMMKKMMKPGNKIKKILQVFHKKVYPEIAMASKKPKKYNKHESRDSNTGHHHDGSDTTQVIQSFNSHSLSGGSDSSGSREYWIKTDSDYLVLEL